MDIPEFKRDDSRDHLNVLKSLNEIPFPVGKKLLVDFLKGELNNPSIEKNELFDCHNFGNLSFLSKEEIEGIIDNLLLHKMINFSPVNFNKFIQVIGITPKGKDELLEPKLNKKPEQKETIVNESELKAFRELNEFLKEFNVEQKKAIISNKEKILCIAGAGSGKTSVLTKRAEFLNKKLRVHKNKILAITFTRKAKEEMRNRLKRSEVEIQVETFNSFCEKILLKNTGKIYGRRMRVASYKDKVLALSLVLNFMGYTIHTAIDKYFTENQKKNKTQSQLQNMFLKNCFSILDYYKLNREKFGEFSKDLKGEDSENAKMICEIVKKLDQHLKMQGLRTYSDQIYDTLSFLKKNKNNVPEFDHILVDEYQDVNDSQVELLDLLNPKNLFCVGDPRQSIFGWRGSDISHILEFHEKHENVEVIHLKKNYRSSKSIVKLMNDSIKNMKMPFLDYEKEQDSVLDLKNFENESEEYEFVSKKILNENFLENRVFVLARTKKQLQEISKYFDKNGIPYILKTEENPNVEIEKGKVTLATIHSIKGLEADFVFVIGCNYSNFPCKASEHPVMEAVRMYDYDRDDEEQRLFYVAISRAKSKLYLSYTGKKHTYFINQEMKRELEYSNS